MTKTPATAATVRGRDHTSREGAVIPLSYGTTQAAQPAVGFIYVIECGGYFKVGWSANPRIRLNHIRGANPLPVTLVGVIEGSREDEAAWHAALRDEHVHGEWFELTDEDVARVLHDSFGIDKLPDEDWIA